MGHGWRDNIDQMVRWADGTYDKGRTCSECFSSTCSMPVHMDRYREIGEDPLLEDDGADGYWAWMHVHQPLGGKRDHDGDLITHEIPSANPDVLSEMQLRQSGIPETTHDLALQAFSNLTPKQQEVWTLVMREQISQTEAARRMGISQQAVAKHLANAKTSYINFIREASDNVTA